MCDTVDLLALHCLSDVNVVVLALLLVTNVLVNITELFMCLCCSVWPGGVVVRALYSRLRRLWVQFPALPIPGNKQP